MISEQAIVFLYSIIVGAFLTFVFDLFKISRLNYKTPNYLVLIQDVIYILILIITIIATAFYYNQGEIRGFMILGYFFGMMLYLLLLHRMIMFVFNSIIKFFKKCFHKFLNLLKNIGSKEKNLKKS